MSSCIICPKVHKMIQSLLIIQDPWILLCCGNMNLWPSEESALHIRTALGKVVRKSHCSCKYNEGWIGIHEWKFTLDPVVCDCLSPIVFLYFLNFVRSPQGKKIGSYNLYSSLRKISLFVRPLIHLYWTLGNVCSGSQSQCGYLVCVLSFISSAQWYLDFCVTLSMF